jgi:hypothetical protein
MTKQINDGKVYVDITVSMRTPLRSEVVDVTHEQALRWKADPDLCAARYFKMTVDEYREWIERNGYACCGALTKDGRPCRAALRHPHGGQLDAGEWKRLHRIETCNAHKRDKRT